MQTSRTIEATCPDCRGPITEIIDDGVVEYRCLVGHRFSPLWLLAAHSEAQERQLWAAVLVLEEAAVIAHEVAAKFPELRERLVSQGDAKKRQAEVIRGVLEELSPFMLE